MKLSNKEKIILAVFLAIAILAAGFFLLVKPEYDRIETNKNSLKAAEDQLQSMYQVLAREETIDGEIQAAFDKANAFAPYFYDDLTILDADELTRQILKDANMSTKGLSIGDFTTSTLTVSDYVDTIVTYPLKEYSGYIPDTGIDFSQFSIEYDEDGNINVPDELKDVMKDYINALLTTQSQTIGSISVSLTIEGTRENFLKFLDYIAGLEKATYIPSVSISYTTGNEAAQQPAAPANADENGTEGAEGAEQPAQQPANNETQVGANSEISMGITITYYCVKPLQEETTAAEEEPETQPEGEGGGEEQQA